MDLPTFFFILFALIIQVKSARILAWYPTPAPSHQSVFRRLTQELVKKEHEVTIITTDPIFPNNDGPINLKEIDLHDISYQAREDILNLLISENQEILSDGIIASLFYLKIIEAQLQAPAVRELLLENKNKFDLIIVEDVAKPSLAMSYVFNAPVILFSTISAASNILEFIGSPTHPLLYPCYTQKRIYNLTLWEKAKELYKHFILMRSIHLYEEEENRMLQKHISPDIPPLRELYKNVDMVFLNVHSIWVDNQPVPPNVIYLGGFHLSKSQELSQNLKTYLDATKHGVIYVSFGTSALSSSLPLDKVEIIAQVLGQLPYDVLWKWDKDELPGQSKNIKLSKWFPQADLLKHPNIKLFITQAGLQSTDEAITAGVPLVAFPVLGDQWFNAEKYVKHGIGEKILFEDVTEHLVKTIVQKVINNEKYRKNIVKLREVMLDQPQTPAERAIWWIDYVIRHKGAKHLRASGANLTYAQYYEIELLLMLCSALFTFIVLFFIIAYYIYKLLCFLLSRKRINNKKIN